MNETKNLYYSWDELPVHLQELARQQFSNYKMDSYFYELSISGESVISRRYFNKKRKFHE